jgi:hypothetical protein
LKETFENSKRYFSKILRNTATIPVSYNSNSEFEKKYVSTAATAAKCGNNLTEVCKLLSGALYTYCNAAKTVISQQPIN